MTAKGKINASNVQINDRIIVQENDGVTRTDTIRPSDTKTGEGVRVARVTGKTFRAASGPYERRGKYIIETTAGWFEAAPIQTMWLAPEDAAGIKRAYAEAVAEDVDRQAALEATPAAEEMDEPSATAQAAEAEAVRDEQRWTLGDILTVHEMALEIQRLADAQTDAWEDRIALERKLSGANRASSIRGLVARDHTDAMALAASPEYPVVARSTASRTLSSQVAGRMLRATEPELVLDLLPPLAHGRELVRVADLEVLTLHSQAGKVDNMNNASETSAPAQPTKHTGSTVVALIERVWDTIRADHPELPEVVVTTGSGEGVKWGHFRPESWKLAEDGGRRHEFFLASEALAKGATQVLQTTIHEAAHTLNRVRGTKDTSRQNRYHNAAFRKTAEELGLEHKGEKGDATHGFSFVTLTAATKTRYAALLAELERELKLTGILPFWLGGTDEEDEKGGEKITGKPVKGKDEGETKSGPVKAVCDCEEPVIIRISQKVMDMGVVRCDDCNSLFHRP